MKIVWAIALGAALGGVSRYYLGSAMQQRFGIAFPWGTLLINIAGSLLLGFIIRYALMTPGMTAEIRALLTTGFCGGFTTFSAFSYETAALLEDGLYERAGAYMLGSVVLAVGATFCGFILAHTVFVMQGRP